MRDISFGQGRSSTWTTEVTRPKERASMRRSTGIPERVGRFQRCCVGAHRGSKGRAGHRPALDHQERLSLRSLSGVIQPACLNVGGTSGAVIMATFGPKPADVFFNAALGGVRRSGRGIISGGDRCQSPQTSF